MRFHPEELKSAQAYWKDRSYPKLSEEQHKAITEKGKSFIRFPQEHPILHHLINLAVLLFIFSFDWWVLLRLGTHIKSPIAAGIIAGVLHG
jgi:hypothetical protein